MNPDNKPTIDIDEIIEFKSIKVLGYTDSVNECQCCGKQDLKGTVALDTNIGIVYFGTTCAYNANKYDTLDAVKKVKREAGKSVRDYKKQLEYVDGRTMWDERLKQARKRLGLRAHEKDYCYSGLPYCMDNQEYAKLAEEVRQDRISKFKERWNNSLQLTDKAS